MENIAAGLEATGVQLRLPEGGGAVSLGGYITHHPSRHRTGKRVDGAFSPNPEHLFQSMDARVNRFRQTSIMMSRSIKTETSKRKQSGRARMTSVDLRVFQSPSPMFERVNTAVGSTSEQASGEMHAAGRARASVIAALQDAFEGQRCGFNSVDLAVQYRSHQMMFTVGGIVIRGVVGDVVIETVARQPDGRFVTKIPHADEGVCISVECAGLEIRNYG